MTPKNTWKSVERRIAKVFGTQRTSLSGGNSKITRSDTMHDKLFIEIKHRANFAVYKLFDSVIPLAKKEDKIPVVVLHQKNSKYNLLVCRLDKTETNKVVKEIV